MDKEPITADWKVAQVIGSYPSTVDVFLRYHCPDMRTGFFSLMARMMSVRSAARVHRLPLEQLVADLNQAVAVGPVGPRARQPTSVNHVAP